MDEKKMVEISRAFLDAWDSQDPERVLACYTDDVYYVDPNTRGAIRGAEDLRRYLVKLFAAWDMKWSLKEAHLFEGGDGCAALWRARISKPGGETAVELDGMDLIMVRGEKIERNEVHFDRTVLMPLLQA